MLLDSAGKTFGRYQVQERLGKGGMGEVYKALDTQLNRFVALKILLDKYIEDESCVKRFEQEARAVSGLNHPHILTVYDIGSLGEGRTFIATEFVAGQTLRKRIQTGAIDSTSMLEIALQTADGLTAAHQAAILHRDIKPENIMLRDDGYVKLLDFGLAKLIGPSNSATQTLPGVILGTPQYMSPEQAIGGPVDARTDIWSFGVVLYEMLTGVCPFSGSTVDEVISSVLNKEPPPISTYKANVQRDLELVVTRAMSKNIDERYASLDHMVSDLKRVQRSLISDNPIANYTTVRDSALARPSASKPRISKNRARKNIKSLAILPFTNETDDSKIDYLSDGITETVINNLSQLPQLRVMSRTSVFRFKGKNLAPTVIGQELGVGAVLTGKLLRVAAKLIVQTELVDVVDGSQIWGFRYDIKTIRVFEIEEKIASEISQKLELKLTHVQKKRLKKRHTTSENAYFNYLKGRFHWNKRSAASVKLAIDYFNQAIEEDPLFAVAFSGLADCYVVLGNQHSLPAKEAFPKAKAAAIRALDIDDSLAEAYVNLGYVKATFDRHWSGSVKAFEKAITLNPDYATAHQWYSVILIALGRFDHSLAESRKACELDPLSRVFNASYGQCLYFARRYDEAVQQYRRMLSIDDDFHWTHYFMGCAYRQQKRYKEALAEFRLALKLVKDEPVILSDLVYTYAVAGQKQRAAILLKKLIKMASTMYVSPYDLAVAHLGLGEKETALDLLEESERARDDGVLMINIDPALDALRSHPRFQALLMREGLAQSSRATP